MVLLHDPHEQAHRWTFGWTSDVRKIFSTTSAFFAWRGVAKGTCGALSARGRRSIRVQSAPWHPPDGYEQATATRLDKICVQQLCKPAVSSTGAPGWLRTRPNCSSSEDSEAATVVIVSRERGRVLPRCRLAKMCASHVAVAKPGAAPIQSARLSRYDAVC